ncbi:23S rRNA-intervening sequence protein [Algoriphagus hitonicola]|uniref:23S rRNA-intervening sequence protein n=1 Tax=Algoriphagus hitonicola TaxID=435880 RepID=A0A1I2XQK2_9BACT|nr:four helix bundle protein [Algoriphagus hitonicola]SFH15778.1 23S rRNA-intervening sequence protein [Algoriphagus hitonicola]
MARIESFEELEIWQIARELCKYVRVLTQKGLFLKDFKFSSQINSAAGSIMDPVK